MKSNMPQEKIILLYLMDSMNLSLSELQLAAIVADEQLMGYFALKEALADLVQSGMIKVSESVNQKLYYISELGHTSLPFFRRELLKSQRDQIDAYCDANRSRLQLEAGLFADYIRLKDSEYRVTLKATEKSSTLFEISFKVFSKEDAEKAIARWRTQAIDLYRTVCEKLL